MIDTTCSDLTDPTNGMISYNMGTASLRPVDTVATYTCATGYTLNGGSTRTCGVDGTWSWLPPVLCQREWNLMCDYSFVECTCFSTGICSDLSLLINGMISYSGESPDMATYTCNTGYTLNGDATRTCGNGGMWSGSDPVCQSMWNRIYAFFCEYFSIDICFDLPLLTNGMISYFGTGSSNNRPVGTMATYTCDTGYTLNGGTTRICESNGMWSGSAPVCQRKWMGMYVYNVFQFPY